MSYKVTVLKTKASAKDAKDAKPTTVSAFSGLADFVVRPTLLAEVLRSELINLRDGNAHTKIRSEVRGGGKKPWKQKGTGRARHGSIRSPLWVGGGVTFGPRNDRNWHSKINRKARVTALKSLFKDRLEDKSVFALDEDFVFAKTKDADAFFAASFKKLPKNVVILYATGEKEKLNGVANLSVNLVNVGNIRLNQLAKGTTYILTPEAIKKCEERLK